MIIRPATVADIPAMMALERTCPEAAHWTEEQYLESFATGVKRIVLVAESSVIGGFLIARHLAPEWELENIAVDEKYRGTGIGKRLIDSLLAHARETNSESVFLEVRESNKAARRLYEKASFQQNGRRRGYYSNPEEDAILYFLSLT